ncbi:BnaC03g44200D [Brassica napus]|uniref:BnaC03g44200D protein n=1 Tax=Brassica napus TaxID=3708 RepID=A0A078FQB8_BRANA|nr:BnaC03g44200D [Brassica napus]
MTSQTYHFSITERNQENSCRPFRRTLTGRWLQAVSTEAAGNGSGHHRRRTPIKLAFS